VSRLRAGATGAGGARDVQVYNCNNGTAQTIEINEKSDPAHYGKAQCKRTDQHNWLGINNPNPYVSVNVEPSDEQKYKCCLAQKENTKSSECGYNYCNENGSLTPACITFLQGTYCRNNPTLPLCRTYADITAKADYCSQGTNLLTDQICKDTCNMDNESVRTKCEQTALRLCREDKNRPGCGCFGKIYNSDGSVNKDDPDYIKFVEGMDPSRIASLGDPECWLQPCAASILPFSDLFRRKKNVSVTCPLCIQNLNINNSNFDDADIKQSCTVKQDTGGKVTSVSTNEEESTPAEEEGDTPAEEGKKSNNAFFGFSSFFICCICCIIMIGLGLMFAS
jgi:hypothetical protein